MVTKSELFKLAWATARRAARALGGRARDYLRGALTRAWAAARQVPEGALTLSVMVHRLRLRFETWTPVSQAVWPVQFVFAQGRRLDARGGTAAFSGREASCVRNIWRTHGRGLAA